MTRSYRYTIADACTAACLRLASPSRRAAVALGAAWLDGLESSDDAAIEAAVLDGMADGPLPVRIGCRLPRLAMVATDHGIALEFAAPVRP